MRHLNEPTHPIVSPHAELQIRARGLLSSEVIEVVRHPDVVLPVRAGRHVFQALRRDTDSRRYWIRVFVDTDRQPPVIVTAYRTTKIEKYRERS